MATTFAAQRAFVAARPAARRVVVCSAQQKAPLALPKVLPAAVKPALLTAASNLLLALPSHAEAGKIFDFNATLPVMMGEFLLLMVFLDKFWFGPVGRVLDERDKELRGKLALVKDNGSEVAKLQAEAERLIGEARAAAQKQVSEAKAVVSAECAKELAEAKAKVDAELSRALATLESEKEAAMKTLDAQVEKLSADILGRVLPEGVRV
jgi:F-type H+-transporting ATPase subunit b